MTLLSDINFDIRIVNLLNGLRTECCQFISLHLWRWIPERKPPRPLSVDWKNKAKKALLATIYTILGIQSRAKLTVSSMWRYSVIIIKDWRWRVEL